MRVLFVCVSYVRMHKSTHNIGAAQRDKQARRSGLEQTPDQMYIRTQFTKDVSKNRFLQAVFHVL